MYGAYPDFWWRLTSSDETNKLHKEIEGGLKTKIGRQLPCWEEAPTFYGEIVHAYSTYPSHLLSDEEYEELSSTPETLPDSLNVLGQAGNVFYSIDGPCFIVSDRLKVLMDELKIAGAFHAYKIKVSFKDEIKVYWIVTMYDEKGKNEMSDYLIHAKMPLKHKVDGNWVEVEQDKVEEFVKSGKVGLLTTGKEKTIHLNDAYDWIFFRGDIYISEAVKLRIENEKMLVSISPIMRVNHLNKIIVPTIS